MLLGCPLPIHWNNPASALSRFPITGPSSELRPCTQLSSHGRSLPSTVFSIIDLNKLCYELWGRIHRRNFAQKFHLHTPGIVGSSPLQPWGCGTTGVSHRKPCARSRPSQQARCLSRPKWWPWLVIPLWAWRLASARDFKATVENAWEPFHSFSSRFRTTKKVLTSIHSYRNLQFHKWEIHIDDETVWWLSQTPELAAQRPGRSLSATCSSRPRIASETLPTFLLSHIFRQQLNEPNPN